MLHWPVFAGALPSLDSFVFVEGKQFNAAIRRVVTPKQVPGAKVVTAQRQMALDSEGEEVVPGHAVVHFELAERNVEEDSGAEG